MVPSAKVHGPLPPATGRLSHLHHQRHLVGLKGRSVRFSARRRKVGLRNSPSTRWRLGHDQVQHRAGSQRIPAGPGRTGSAARSFAGDTRELPEEVAADPGVSIWPERACRPLVALSAKALCTVPTALGAASITSSVSIGRRKCCEDTESPRSKVGGFPSPAPPPDRCGS